MGLRHRFYRVHPELVKTKPDRVQVDLLAPEHERNAVVHFCSFDKKGGRIIRRSEYYTAKATPELPDPALKSHEMAMFLHQTFGDQRKMCVPAHAWIFDKDGWNERKAYADKLEHENAVFKLARKVRRKVKGSHKHMWEGAEASNAVWKRYATNNVGCLSRKPYH